MGYQGKIDIESKSRLVAKGCVEDAVVTVVLLRAGWLEGIWGNSMNTRPFIVRLDIISQ